MQGKISQGRKKLCRYNQNLYHSLRAEMKTKVQRLAFWEGASKWRLMFFSGHSWFFVLQETTQALVANPIGKEPKSRNVN